MLVGIDASRAVAAERTGTETYSLYLIREMLWQGSRHRFRLYFRDRSQVALFPPDDGRWEPRVIPFPRLWTHLRLSWEMALRPPDALFVPAHVLPLVHPRRSVVTVHDLGYLHFPEAHRPFERWYLDWSTRFNCRAAARVLALSEATRRDLVQRYRVPREKIQVVYPGVRKGMEPEAGPVRAREVLRKYGLRSPYYLYVGTLQPRKNLVRLVQAFAQARQSWSGAEEEGPSLVLVGKKGWQYESLVQEVERLGLEEWVTFPGYVPDEDLPALLGGALAFVFPSLYEGFGLPIVEAMSCGAPVICSDTSACGEVAGETALLVDPLDVGSIASAMVRLRRDAGLRESLRIKGRERARLFAWPEAAAQVLGVLEALAEDTPAQGGYV